MGAEGKSKEELEEEISTAMRSRVADFREKANSLTLEGVRRVLEKDLGMQSYALDAHKRFIKQCLDKYFYDAVEPDAPKSPEVDTKMAVQLETGDEKVSSGIVDLRNESRSPISDIVVKEELPPVVAKETPDPGVEGTEDVGEDSEISEDNIVKAIKKRVRYFRENTTNITMSGVRRLLEEDLGLGSRALDSYKAFIKKKLDEILVMKDPEPRKEAKCKNIKKETPSMKKKKGKEASLNKDREIEESEDLPSQSETPSDSEGSDEDTKPKKRSAKEVKTRVTEVSKRLKISSKESKPSISGRRKPESVTTKRNVTHNIDDASEDDHSHSSVEESPKKIRENQAPSYGKKVEHLKSIIRSCGMSVPPSLYRKAKQAKEDEREAFLIREMEGILEREGLSSNPSEKGLVAGLIALVMSLPQGHASGASQDIKAVKKQKERAKELEGIDTSNIVLSSRRRTTSNFIPPKPKSPVLSESEEEEEDDEDNSDDVNTDGVSSDGSEDDAEESE